MAYMHVYIHSSWLVQRQHNVTQLRFRPTLQITMEIVLPIASGKRARLNECLREMNGDLQDVRRKLAAFKSVARRRLQAQAGKKRRRQLILLRLIQGFMPNKAVPLCIAKLLLPHTLWNTCQSEGCVGEARHLERLLNQPKIVEAATLVLSDATTSSHLRTIKKAKRLATEQVLFFQVLQMNKTGVTPKRNELLQSMERAWPVTGDASDNVPNHIASRLRWTDKWFARFRKFWHISFSRLPTKGVMTEEEQGLKALGCRAKF